MGVDKTVSKKQIVQDTKKDYLLKDPKPKQSNIPQTRIEMMRACGNLERNHNLKLSDKPSRDNLSIKIDSNYREAIVTFLKLNRKEHTVDNIVAPGEKGAEVFEAFLQEYWPRFVELKMRK